MPEEEYKNVAVCGVRQMEELVKAKELKMAIADPEKKPARQIYLTAYTNPLNIASEKVLEKETTTSRNSNSLIQFYLKKIFSKSSRPPGRFITSITHPDSTDFSRGSTK